MDEETRVKRRSNSACNRCHSEHDELGFESSRLHVISDSLSSPCLIDQLSSVPPPSSSSSPSHRHEETSESQLVEQLVTFFICLFICLSVCFVTLFQCQFELDSSFSSFLLEFRSLLHRSKLFLFCFRFIFYITVSLTVTAGLH